MKSLDEYNIVVDGVSLVNEWRKTTSRIVEGRSDFSTSKTASIEFIIEGDDEEDLADHWNITKSEFNRQYAEIYGYRETSSIKDFVYSMNDGETIKTHSNVSIMPQQVSTRFSLCCVLEILAEMSDNVTGGGIPAIGTEQPAVEGMLTQLEIVRLWETGQTETASTVAAFQTVAAPESDGPYSITTITEDSGTGYALLTLGSSVSDPPDDGYVTITGTVRYNGKHRIHAFGGSTVILRRDFIEAEAGGVANFGEIKTSAELAEAGEDTILELLGVGEEGTMSLVHRVLRDNGDGTHELELVAQEQDFLPDGGGGPGQLVAALTMRVVPVEEDGWQNPPDLSSFGAGVAPINHVVEGQVVFRRSVSSGDLKADWDTVEDDIIGRAQAATGNPDWTPVVTRLSFDLATPAVAFTFEAIENYNDVLMMEQITSREEPNEDFIYARGDGFHGIQNNNSEPIHVITRKIVRLGVGREENFKLPALTEDGYYMHLHHTSYGPDKDNISHRELGDDFSLQTVTETWFRLLLEEEEP